MNGTKKIGDWHIRAIAGLSRKKDKKYTLRTRAGLLPASTIRTTYQKLWFSGGVDWLVDKSVSWLCFVY